MAVLSRRRAPIVYKAQSRKLRAQRARAMRFRIIAAAIVTRQNYEFTLTAASSAS